MDDYEHPTTRRLRRRTLKKITLGVDIHAPQDTDETLDEYIARKLKEREERRKARRDETTPDK